MNQNYVDYEVYKWEGSYADSFNSGRILTPINRHNFPPTLEE
jgi:hypothetical protein